MIRRIIQIDDEKCTGCGICAEACHEGAIGIVDGKAVLLRDDYCDGLGDCLPTCPAGAIEFIERDAAEYDESAVAVHKAAVGKPVQAQAAFACPSSRPRAIEHGEQCAAEASCAQAVPSELRSWPVQIKLAPTHAKSFDGVDLLIAADCTAYSYGNFHRDFMRDKTVLIGCTKLDAVDYSEKLAVIFAENDIKSITVVKMEVPCCSGLMRAVSTALEKCGKQIPWKVVTISIEGDILA